MSVGILFDSTLCIGCLSCSVACKETHHLSGEPNPRELNSETFSIVKERDGSFCRHFCRHCLKPACVSACPVGALRKLKNGAVVYNGKRCIGCRYCLLACPYYIPRYQWSQRNPLVRKCDFCIKLLEEDKPPACAQVCPTEATKFGERGQLLEEARKKIQANRESYYPHIFGEREAGGSSVLMLASKPLSEFGILVPKITTPLPELTASALNKTPVIILGGSLILGGIWFLTRRKNQVARAERETKNRKVNEQE